jgi:small subunit ribosomal protein S6
MKRIYETIVIYDVSLDEAAIDQKIQKIDGIIKANDGVAEKVEKWGKRVLAYEINKKREGFYLYVRHTSETSVVEQLKNLFHYDELVIKHMNIVVEEIRKSRFTKKSKPVVAPKEVVAAAAVAEEVVAEPIVKTEETNNG